MNVYLVDIGQLSNIDNKFHFYNKLVFSSKKSMENYVNSVLEVDKATDIAIEDVHPFYSGEVKRKHLDFTTKSVVESGETPVPMRIRLAISHMRPHVDVGPRPGFRFDKTEIEKPSSVLLSEVKVSEEYNMKLKVVGKLGSGVLKYKSLDEPKSKWQDVDYYNMFEQQEADEIGFSEIELFEKEVIRLFGRKFLQDNVVHFKGVM